MSEKIDRQIPTRGEGHYYSPNGVPVYELIGRNGEARQVTVRDARQLGLVPSVTTIYRVVAKPALERWQLRQMLLAGMRVPRADGESDEMYAERVATAAFDEVRQASQRGTLLHEAIEKWLVSGQQDETYGDLLERIHGKLVDELHVDLGSGRPEQTFAFCGYGGRVDWHRTAGHPMLLDFKSKRRIESYDKLVYDEHLVQCAAYAAGIGLPIDAIVANVFVGVEDGQVAVVRHSPESLLRGWKLFCAAFDLWRRVYDYEPPGSERFHEGVWGEKPKRRRKK